MRRNLEFLKSYAEDFNEKTSQSILMMGGTGLGKTHLSSAVARRIIEKGKDVFYTGAIDLFSAFEVQRFKSYSNEPNELIERYFECDLLIIDDLGTEMINQFSVSTLYNLLNDRLSRRKPTIVSTNLTTDEIQKKYTDRITSRMLGEYKVLFFAGTDVRAQKLMKR
jgi:DNA replication protein DnaC